MTGGQLIREARRRAGLTQQALADRLGTAQSVVARWESEATAPSFDTVVRVVRACGFELDVRLLAGTDGFADDWSLAVANLSLTPAQRLANHRAAVELAERGRKAMRRAKARRRG